MGELNLSIRPSALADVQKWYTVTLHVYHCQYLQWAVVPQVIPVLDG